MTSLDLAKNLNKPHRNILRKIRSMNMLCEEEFYKDSTGKFNLMFRLTKTQYKNVAKAVMGARAHLHFKEQVAVKVLGAILGRSILRQFKCGKYRIDAYDPIENVCYEFDESHHKYRTAKDLQRQKFIEASLGCKFVRINI